MGALIIAALLMLGGGQDDRTAGHVPSANEVLRRSVEALGGTDAILRHRTRVITGEFEIPRQRLRGEVVMSAAAPSKLLVRTTLPAVGETKSGFDGTTGWALDPLAGARLIEGPALAQIARQADFYAVLHRHPTITSVTSVSREPFDGVTALKVRVVTSDGDEFLEFFAEDTGLPIGSVGTQRTPMGPVAVVTVLKDYKGFEGVLLPTTIEQTAAGVMQRILVRSVSHGPLADGVFDLPPAVRLLKDKGK